MRRSVMRVHIRRSPRMVTDGEGPDYSVCPVALEGIVDGPKDIVWEDSFQALTLAISFARKMLEGIIEEGGRVLYSDGETDWALRSMFGLGADEGRTGGRCPSRGPK